MPTAVSEYTRHPRHEEEYDEFEPYSYTKLPDRDQVVLVEERIQYDDDDNIHSFSIIILCNAGDGYEPIFELQHEPRSRYPESINLKRSGIEVWELGPNYTRLGSFDCNFQPDFEGLPEHECYQLIKTRFDVIVRDVLSELENFRRGIAQ
ncbi:hypothetical protein PM022_07230 [Halorubrum ezzemoulense]|uniref:hypothetical protein n=1 Tax=Halorubrum ezzemoulense TaxID=337243 RepID=UPI00232E390D|nr:hypothetical protein [Halorubrum ezzemoulense]MDB2274342.1 hypothetical protein [Halorubrum ezzemoulense]